MFYFVNRKGVEGTSFRWFFYLKDMKTTEFFRENHRNRKNGISFGNLYFRDTAFFLFVRSLFHHIQAGLQKYSLAPER